jgi:hypothetical protein
MALPLGLLVPATAQGASPTPSTVYAIGKHVCRLPVPGHASCLAMRRVIVTKATAGARPIELPSTSALAGGRSRTAMIGPAGGLTPGDLATAYGYSPTATGAGQTIAIVAAFNDPNLNADLQTFDSNYSLAACSTSDGCLKIVNETGGAVLPAADTTGWSAEETLDVESAHSVCQHCKILLVEATTDSMTDLAKAENEAAALGATEISNSYGDSETGWASVASSYNHPGIVITAGSGDDGYYNYDQLGASTPSPFNQPYAPASFRTVVAVGGTTLYLGQTAARQAEVVWNDNGIQAYNEANLGVPLGATGGGCSTYVPVEGWQKGLATWPSTDCGSHRLVADIAADADPLTGFDIYDTYNCGTPCGTPGWQTTGGTSLSSPLIAGMYALAGGAHGVAYPALTLYGHLGGTSLYDVTSGGDGLCGGEGAAACSDPNTLGLGILDCAYPASGTAPSSGDRACDALSGYDGPTGVGTPVGLGVFAKTGPRVTLSGPLSVAHATTHKWTAVALDPFPGGTIASYAWNWGDGSTPTITTTPSATHVYTKGGVKETVTLTVKDTYGQLGTATRTVKVS